MLNFFGTDGIRGTYGSTITDGTAFLLGKSLALLGDDCPIIVIARDTRLSGESLFKSLSQGIYEGGGNVINLGILPTNGVGHFVRKFGGDYGVMITASHNPPNDNGLKVFDRYGVKLCVAKQKVVSNMMDSLKYTPTNSQTMFEPVFYDIENIYVEDVIRGMGVDLSDVNVALDCCYGSAYRVAQKIFEKVYANVTAFCNVNKPQSINVGCGATCVEFLRQKIANASFDLAFAFDGDADRLAVFEKGVLVDNSKVFYAMAKYLHQRNALKNDTVVGTVLTNGGVENALNNLGITLLRTPVGDTNVFNAMARNGLNLGGEQSGHYLLTDFATTSDAIINALFVAKIYKQMGSILQYANECQNLPCQSQDIPITLQNQKLATQTELEQTARRVTELYPNCRIVLRKSGTEPKIRAYVEGQQCVEALKSVIATFV